MDQFIGQVKKTPGTALIHVKGGCRLLCSAHQRYNTKSGLVVERGS